MKTGVYLKDDLVTTLFNIIHECDDNFNALEDSFSKEFAMNIRLLAMSALHPDKIFTLKDMFYDQRRDD